MLKTNRQLLLEDAIIVTTGDRKQTYGEPVEGMQRFADLITAYLRIEKPLTAVDAAMICTLLKVSRTAANARHKDNFIDGAAYMAIAWECAMATHEDDR